MRYLLSECPMQERGHLTQGDEARRAVPIIDRRVTAFGDRGGAELVDVILEDRVVIVDEQSQK